MKGNQITKKVRWHLNLFVANIDLVEARENYKLTLRKKKIDDFISTKRDISQQQNLNKESNYEININVLNIPQEVKEKKFESANDFYSFILQLLKSEDLNFVKFGVYLLRVHLSSARGFEAALNEHIEVVYILHEKLSKMTQDYSIIVSIMI